MKARYSGMDLSDAKRLKQLDEENTKLRRLVVGHCRSEGIHAKVQTT